ncbi:hypothetical protein niasHS_004683 [Heterodera schachtii]|uniref:BTB domain-containing protein n=1 Tax=Heterodera schachtii TaxID=97005 RepID=A0ABD2JS95_HETSC
MSESAAKWTKLMLSTGDYADVHFLVGDGDEKELLLAHKLILKNASDVFAAMFRFDAKKERAENASANCPVVEVPDVEASAFKVMLSFIYTDDLNKLNGDNAMAVLYAAKKYNIPGLIGPCLDVPVSELFNVFLAYAQARLFDLENYANNYEEFSKNIVPSGVLTTEEVIGVQQHKFQLNFNHFSDPLLLPKFPSEKRIWKEGTLLIEIAKVSEFARESIWSERKSETVHIGGLPWKIWAQIEENYGSTNNEKCLNIFLLCDAREEDKNWSCKCSATLRIISQNNGAVNYIRTFCDHILNIKSNYLELEGFTFAQLMDPNNGFYKREEDKLKLAIDVTVKDEKKEKYTLDQSNSEGTISIEIAKVSEFARESIGSERKSETVRIKGFPWKIWAEIGKNDESTDNEKCLNIFLLCDAPKEDKNWSCKCSGTLRI